MKIYCLCHKAVEYGLPKDSIQCGAALHPAVEGAIPDNTGDNISELNPFYAELTGIYWLWKNKKDRIKGVYQYRRRLPEVELGDYEVITCIPMKFSFTLKEQYHNCHNVEDIELCESVVKELYPDYADDWDRVINRGKKLYYSNGFIMRGVDFNNYCKFLFSVLKEVWNRKGFKSIEDLKEHISSNSKYKYVASRGQYYQCQIGGFLSERLYTLYILHNFTKIKEEAYITFEGV